MHPRLTTDATTVDHGYAPQALQFLNRIDVAVPGVEVNGAPGEYTGNLVGTINQERPGFGLAEGVVQQPHFLFAGHCAHGFKAARELVEFPGPGASKQHGVALARLEVLGGHLLIGVGAKVQLDAVFQGNRLEGFGDVDGASV